MRNFLEIWNLGGEERDCDIHETPQQGARCNTRKESSKSESTTGEKLFGGSTKLDLFVYPVGQVWLLHASPASAETILQGYPLHVLRQLQHLQNIDRTS